MLKQVQNGIDFLNDSQVVPKDWYNKIDLDRLNMKSLGDCVLGQIRSMVDDEYFGTYEYDLGFDINDDYYYLNESDKPQAFNDLKETWRSEIEKLRSKD